MAKSEEHKKSFEFFILEADTFKVLSRLIFKDPTVDPIKCFAPLALRDGRILIVGRQKRLVGYNVFRDEVVERFNFPFPVTRRHAHGNRFFNMKRILPVGYLNDQIFSVMILTQVEPNKSRINVQPCYFGGDFVEGGFHLCIHRKLSTLNLKTPTDLTCFKNFYVGKGKEDIEWVIKSTAEAIEE